MGAVKKKLTEAAPSIQDGRSPVSEDQPEAEAAQAQEAAPAYRGPEVKTAGFRQSPQNRTILDWGRVLSSSEAPFERLQVSRARRTGSGPTAAQRCPLYRR